MSLFPDPESRCPNERPAAEYQYHIFGEHYHFNKSQWLRPLDQVRECRALGGKLPEARDEIQADALFMISCEHLPFLCPVPGLGNHSYSFIYE